MTLYYYNDTEKHRELNRSGADYTPAYIPIFLKNLGFFAKELLPNKLQNLKKDDTVIIGADTLDSKKSVLLANSGCNILAFGTKADNIFPKTERVVTSDRYDIAGYFKFCDSDEPLPILSAFDRIIENSATLGKIDNTHTAFTAINNIYYFSFDLPATMLYSADGKPTLKGENGFSVGRVPDGCVLEQSYDYSIAYNDSYLRKIEDILHGFGFASVFALPVTDGKVCDMALYFAGDDDAHSKENDMASAENMFKRGLPYHLNLMPKDDECNFVVSKDDVDKLHAMGCETAIHYDFTKFPFTLEGHKKQILAYEKEFGKSGGPVNHCLIQTGTAPERYMMQIECGAKYDNNRFQNKVDPDDINAFNLTGFGFGHAFPRFCMADAKSGNIPLEFCELYMSYYEPRIIKGTREEYEKIEKYLDDSYKYARTSQLFTHPHYISGKTRHNPEYALCALEYAKDYVIKNGWNVWFCAPDALGEWWHRRAKCDISDSDKSGFTVNNKVGQQISVILPYDKNNVAIDGELVTTTQKNIGGRRLILISVDDGIHRVTYN